MTFWVAGAVATSAVVGGISANKAANAQASSARKGMEAQERMFERQIELQEPFRKAGLKAKNRLLDYFGLSDRTDDPNFNKYSGDFSMDDFQADPGYAFRLKEGLKALDASAAARGGLLSGSALRGATRYGQEAASQEYQNAFNRYQINRSNQLTPLQSLMGAGQTATNTMGAAAANYGNAAQQGYSDIGNARASGYVGVGNAINSGIGSYMGYQSNQNLVNALRPGGMGGNASGGYAAQGVYTPGSGAGWGQGSGAYLNYGPG